MCSRRRSAMKRYLASLTIVLLAGTMFLGSGSPTGAWQAPPPSQLPEEIPAQYPPEQPGQSQRAQNDSGAARVSFIHGDLSTQHSDSSEWVAATLNTPVVNGDHVSTGKRSRAEIQLDHANILRMSDESTANVEIDTPNVASRPQMNEGSYRISVNSKGETIVDVRKGSAEISTAQGSTRVDRDQRITIQGNADNAQYNVSAAYSKDDWDKWNSDRDHTIGSAESWHHTNPYYTGSHDLDSYGHWSNVPDYGSVWFPSADTGWAPYREGRWVYEPGYDWTWVSYEPWGWAPYHYGRWFVYGGNWGWWPGPVYGGYYPIWAPAYVSFFGFGGGGWGGGIGFGFGGGFGNVGWLPCGPGDRFFPWYGRGGDRVNVVTVNNITNITTINNIHNNGGMNPLREGPHAFSNIQRATSDARVRGGISSMQSKEFGHGRVPMQQSRVDAGSFRQASMMTGAHPVSPSRESFRPTDRQVNPSSIPNRASSNQHFFSSNARQGASVQAEHGGNNFNRGGNPTNGQPQQNTTRPGFNGFGQTNNGNVNRGSASEQMSRQPKSSNQGQRGFTPPSSQQGQSIQSSRPGWRTFTPPSGQQNQSNGGRKFESQGAPQSRSSSPQPSAPPRQFENNSRGGSNGGTSNRPTMNMQQPVVTPRGGAFNSGRPAPSAPSGNNGPFRGEQPGASPYSGRPAPSAPSGGYGGGGYHGGPSGGGSYSGRPMPSAPSGGGHGGGSSGG